MSIREFDAIIIGAGQAGPSLAGRLNDAGMRVAIIERHLVGGTCVNTGCKPTKTLIASAYAARPIFPDRQGDRVDADSVASAEFFHGLCGLSANSFPAPLAHIH